MIHIKGAIFDMDGTLLDSMPVWDRLSQRVLRPYGVTVTPRDYAALEAKTQFQGAQYFLNTYPSLSLSAQQLVTEMNDMICKRYETIARPKNGVFSLLNGLSGRSVSMAVATLTDRRHAEKALQDRDMLRYFDFLLTIEDVGVSKRDPTIYLQAAEKLRCSPAECMVFEDAPYAAQSAKRAGFLVCGVAEPAYAKGLRELRQASDFFVERSFEELRGKLY